MRGRPRDWFPLVKRYDEGAEVTQLVAEFGIERSNINRAFKRLRVIRRKTKRPRRHYTLDESAFDTITPESAYWLGFLMADGNVYQDREKTRAPTIVIGLATKDRDHVQSFANFLKTDMPIRSYERTRKGTVCLSTRLKVSSARLANTLEEWGVTPRKSGREEASWLLITSPCFWRGVFDGDGCLSRGKSGSWTITMLGSKKLLLQFLIFLGAHGITPASRIRFQTGIHRIAIGGNIQVGRLLDVLYQTPEPRLDRKYLKYQQFINEYIKGL